MNIIGYNNPASLSMDLSNLTLHMSPPAVTHEKPFCFISLSIHIAVALAGTIINTVLFYAQTRFTSWPFYQRILFLNVTFASALAAFVRLGQNSYQVWRYASSGNGSLGESEWSDELGDVALTAIAIGIDILALQNLLALRKCDGHLNQTGVRKDGKKKQIFLVIGMIGLSWLIASLFQYFELNPQSEIYNDHDEADGAVLLCLCIGLAMQGAVVVILLLTRRTLARLQIDFEIRGAQQTLAIRTHIKETLRMTTIIFRVLIAHVIIWIIALAVGFGINRYLKRDLQNHPGHPDNLVRNSTLEYKSAGDPVTLNITAAESRIHLENQIAAFTSVVDMITLVFSLIYPIIAIRLEPRLKRHMNPCCQSASDSNGANGAKSSKVTVIAVPPAACASTHRNAIEKYWDKVAQVTFDRKTSPGNGNKIVGSKIAFALQECKA